MKPMNRNKGKPGKEVLLPNRGAMNKLVQNPAAGGQPLTEFAHLTPDGLTAPQTYPQLVQMGLRGAKVG